MKRYKPFLIQKMSESSPVRDSMEFGVRVKHIPFKIFPDMKELSAVSFLDEDGDDEYIPERPYFEAYEMECEFVYMGLHGTANQKIREFLEYLAMDGAFYIYDTYTGIGRGNVRYVKYDEDVLYRRGGENDAVIFKVTLKVNSPMQEIILEK